MIDERRKKISTEKKGDSEQRPKGRKSKPSEIMINRDWCKGCRACVVHCPTGVLEMSEDFNASGYHTAAAARPDDCISCWLCEFHCPDFAIWLNRK